MTGRITFSGTFDIKKVSEILRKYKSSKMDEVDCILEIINVTESKEDDKI